MDKILRVVEVKVKLREKELKEADGDGGERESKERASKAKKAKQIEEKDEFFTTEEVVHISTENKQIVQRNGSIAMPWKPRGPKSKIDSVWLEPIRNQPVAESSY